MVPVLMILSDAGLSFKVAVFFEIKCLKNDLR